MVGGFRLFNKANGATRISDASHINLIESKCPNCHAPLFYNDSLTTVACNYCGASFIVDDLATTTDRILRARSDAKERDLKTQIEYEREHIKYDPAEREAERQSQQRKMILKGCVIAFAVLFVVILGMNISINAKMEAIDKKNEAYVEQAQEYINQGDYDNALLTANRIDGDRSLSRNQDDKWDAQRESLIRFIKEKQASGE